MPGNKIALALALICALTASVIVYRTVKQNSAPKVIETPKVDVVYAKENIPARTIIAAEQLEIRKISKDAVGADFVTKIGDAAGLIAKAEILPGEPINRNRLVAKGQKLGLSFAIPPGMRAITIAMDEVVGVAGFVKPGEHVDLLGTIEFENPKSTATWTVLQDIEVLAVSQEMADVKKEDTKNNKDNNNTSKKDEAKLGTSVTLAVTPYQAEQVALAGEKGTLRLTLRPLLKEEQLKIPPIKDSNLLPVAPVVRSKTIHVPTTPAPKKRQIEIISGGKSQLITVD